MTAPRPLGVHNIPKQGAMHLAWRYWVYTRAHDEPAIRPVFRQACARSCLFYLNTFVWIKEPRKIQSTLPFATFDFQDDMVNALVDRIRRSATETEPGKVYDVLTEKSRGMGVTWTCLAVFDWFWRFHQGCEFLCISEKEDKVDRAGDLAPLFQKLDFVEERVPVAVHDAVLQLNPNE